MVRRTIGLIVASIVAASIVAALVTASPVYSAAQVRAGLLSVPASWVGRTVQIRALDSYPGGRVAWLVDPTDSYNPYSKGLPIAAGRWQDPAFPRSLIWWLNNRVSALRGIDGGRVEVYRITLTKPLRGACASWGHYNKTRGFPASCVVGHG